MPLVKLMKAGVSTKQVGNCIFFWLLYLVLIILLVILNASAPPSCNVYGTEWSADKKCCVYSYFLPEGAEPQCYNLTTLCEPECPKFVVPPY